MKNYALVNWKGGCGKTFLTVHLGAIMAQKFGQRVVIVDTDSQGDSMTWFSGGKWNGEPTFTANKMDGIFLPHPDFQNKGVVVDWSRYDIALWDGRPDFTHLQAMFELVKKHGGFQAVIAPVEGRLSFHGAERLATYIREKISGTPIFCLKNKVYGAMMSLTVHEAELLDKAGLDVIGFCLPNSGRCRQAEDDLKFLWEVPYGNKSQIVGGLTLLARDLIRGKFAYVISNRQDDVEEVAELVERPESTYPKHIPKSRRPTRLDGPRGDAGFVEARSGSEGSQHVIGNRHVIGPAESGT